ncbi:MAG: NTP transferase domain-containing protein [Desulfobacterota bacterium]|nr:NTP transferase domain-containing protein [Thermodesulfobacteriota bacterium]
MTDRLNVVILAAGEGKRMRSKIPKVMHEILFEPMIRYVIRIAKGINPKKIVVVLGFGKDEVIDCIKDEDIRICIQEEQKGTAHALLCAEEEVKDGDVLVLYGDVPLIKEETLKNFIGFFEKTKDITFLVTKLKDPKGYGRVILKGDSIEKIVEEKEAISSELKIKMVNTGVCVIPSFAFPLIRRISNKNKSQEFYLTDICLLAKEAGKKVKAFIHHDPLEVLGINTKEDLFFANCVMRERIIKKHLENGVIIFEKSVTIGPNVSIGKDTKIWGNSLIIGNTTIGERVEIGSFVVIKDSIIEGGAKIGSFVYLDGFKVGRGEKIPNFFSSEGGRPCVGSWDT